MEIFHISNGEVTLKKVVLLFLIFPDFFSVMFNILFSCTMKFKDYKDVYTYSARQHLNIVSQLNWIIAKEIKCRKEDIISIASSSSWR
jgi:hypothetical protein